MVAKIELSPIDGKSPISIWGRVRETTRLSQRGKALMFGLAVLLVAAIVIGVMMAGSRHDNNKGGAGRNSLSTASAAGVGATAPPTPKKEEGVLRVRDAAVTPSQPSVPGQTQPTGQQANLTGGGTGPSLEDDYKLWLKKHKLDKIKGEILAADAALTAEVAKSGGYSPPLASVRSVGKDEDDPLAQVNTARRAAIANAIAGQPGQTTSPAGQNRMPGVDAGGVTQATHKAFLAEAGNPIYLNERVQPRIGQHELVAGSVIPAVLLSAVNSDLPGVISAQVRQTIYDTHNPAVVVVPQGSRLIGRYSSEVGYAQERVLVAWDSLVFPNGMSIDLKGMLGADGQGQGGFQDKVDNHFFRTWGSAFLISMLGVGMQLSQPQNSGAFNTPSSSAQAAGAVANSLNDAGSKILSKNLGLAPTLQIRPGYAFNVMVNRTIIMPAYRER